MSRLASRPSGRIAFNPLDIFVLELVAVAGIVALWLGLGLIEWVYAHVVQWVSVLAHEVGHGICALATGRSVTIVVGRVDALIAFRLGRVAFKLDPRLGEAYCDYGEPEFCRRTAVLVTLGGPLASMLQALAAAAIAYRLLDSALALAMVSALFLIGGVVGVAQLIPFGDREGSYWKGWLRLSGEPSDGDTLRALLRPHLRTAADAHALLQRRLGRSPGAAENREPTLAEMQEFEDRLAREIGRPEYTLLRMHIDRVLAALPLHDDPRWQDESFRPDVDWDEVLGDMPGYRRRGRR